MVPVSAPLLADCGTVLIPTLSESIQRDLGLLQRSGLEDHSEFLVAVQVDAQGIVDSLAPDAFAVPVLNEEIVQERDQVDLIQELRLSGHHLVGYGVGEPRVQLGQDGHLVEIFVVSLDIARMLMPRA